ncbi:MAG: hypothetical protein GXO74_10870 [Calditrichaeota bacterium]|nr:hypothetical protein [Calditrichota bacterium]
MSNSRKISLPKAVLIITVVVLIFVILGSTPLGKPLANFAKSPTGKTILIVLVFVWLALALLADYRNWSEYSLGRKIFAVVVWVIIIVFFIKS